MVGFDCHAFGDPLDFLAASRDEVSMLMASCLDPAEIVPSWRLVDKVWNVYVRVDDVEEIDAEIQRRGTPIDYAVYDVLQGFREFGVTDSRRTNIASKSDAAR